MTVYRRNVLVGVTVIASLIILAWMILKFAGRSASLFSPPQINLIFECERADGISDGSAVLYRGVSEGRVTRVYRAGKADDTTVYIDATVNTEPPLPANLQGVIRSASLLGGTAQLALEIVGNAPSSESLKDNAHLKARYVGLDLLPPEFADAAHDLKLTSQQFRESNVVLKLGVTIESAQKTIDRAGEVLESVHKLIEDPAMRKDLSESLANIRKATDTATRVARNLEDLSTRANTTLDGANGVVTDARGAIGDARTAIGKTQAHIDELAGNLNGRVTQLSKILDSMQSVATKIDQGNGTAAKLVNDPALYQSLVQTSKELNVTITDLKRLIEQWEQEGVTLKLR